MYHAHVRIEHEEKVTKKVLNSACDADVLTHPTKLYLVAKSVAQIFAGNLQSFCLFQFIYCMMCVPPV